MANSTLNAIRTKVRRITRCPSTAQLSTADLDEYINTFVLYDFPEHLRLFSLREDFTFVCNPYQDIYVTDTSLATTDPLYDFKNRYITVHPPVYIAGYQRMYSQSPEQFFGIYPKTNNIASIGFVGDGVTTAFSGFLTNVPVLANNVLFDSIDSSGNGLALVDYPTSNTTGSLGLPGVPQVLPVPYGFINYVTGAFTVNFPTAPGDSQQINSQTVPYVPSLPQALLYFDDKFTLRPVPDQPYRVQFQVYRRPTELLDSGQKPELEQWWQWIAIGSAKKLFEDRLDMDSVALIMPEYKKQETLVLRRTIVENTNQRTATIFTEQIGPWSGLGNTGGFGNNTF